MNREEKGTAIEDTIVRAHTIVWAYRNRLHKVWPTPPPADCLAYAYCEMAEAVDADLRIRRSGDNRNAPADGHSVDEELADCAMMVLSAFNGAAHIEQRKLSGAPWSPSGRVPLHTIADDVAAMWALYFGGTNAWESEARNVLRAIWWTLGDDFLPLIEQRLQRIEKRVTE